LSIVSLLSTSSVIVFPVRVFTKICILKSPRSASDPQTQNREKSTRKFGRKLRNRGDERGREREKRDRRHISHGKNKKEEEWTTASVLT